MTTSKEEVLGGDAPCADCGQEDNVRWFTDNVFWNAVMGTEDRGAEKTNDERLKILCVPCFARRAQKVYRVKKWRLIAEFEWQELK